MFKRSFCLILVLGMLVGVSACAPAETAPSLNGIPLSEFTIVYSSDDLDYSYRAALYLKEQIVSRTGSDLQVAEDDEGPFAHEIIVGQTGRALSAQLNPQLSGMEFAIFADESHIAMEGTAFTVAAAAYYFAETYIAAAPTGAEIPKEVSIHSPIVKDTTSVIFLIGDGMGPWQTRMFEFMTPAEDAVTDGETLFYGYLFPAQGFVHTNSLSGTTDSAASGTALSTGYKTINKYIGRDKDLKDLQSLTELAASLGKATAVMSTDAISGATPSAFSAHADDRNDEEAIFSSQMSLVKKHGTSIVCGLNSYDNATLEEKITVTLRKMAQSENGFFLMYEEGHIDKHCHNNDMEAAFGAVVRFNQAIGLFMEYAFYHPDTFVLITADHETGDLRPEEENQPTFHSGNHSSADVPVFAYGAGSSLFQDMVIENTQIPKTIASFWGVTDFGDPQYSALS